MAIPRKPKPTLAPEIPAAIPSPEVAVAEALAPLEAVPAVLAAPAQVPPPLAEPVEAAAAVGVDLHAIMKDGTEKAMAEAKATQERMRAAAEQGLEQTRAAYAKMKEAAEEATSSLETSYAAAARGWSELNSKAIDLVKAQADAHFEHVKAIMSAKTMPELFTLQTEHLKARLDAANEQIKDLASTAQKMATEAGEPIKAILTKRFAA